MPIYNSEENEILNSLEKTYINEVAYQPPPQMPAPQTGQEVRTAPQPETRKAPTARKAYNSPENIRKGIKRIKFDVQNAPSADAPDDLSSRLRRGIPPGPQSDLKSGIAKIKAEVGGK